MNAHSPVPGTDDPAAFTQAALRRQAEVLERLSEAALELAMAIKDQAVDGGTAAEAALPFSRVARSARMIALLQSRLLKDMDEARARNRLDPDSEEGMIAAAQESLRLDPERHLRKLRVERIFDRVAKAHTDDEERIGRLLIEAGERLDDDDIYGDILQRPVGELVALLCRDLGLDPDWTRLAEEAWAQEEIASGAWALPRPPPLAGEGDREAVEGAQCAALLAEERAVEGAGGYCPPFYGSS
jgi:hypothetical protein